jgi:D-arabinose 5-phosphate isomerase GutQ
MVDRRPVQTSAVYLLGPGTASQFPAIPPPSPPSPVTPDPSNPCTPIEELDLYACTRDYGQSDDDYNVPSSNTSVSNEFRDTAPLDDRLAAAVHVLSTEAAALSSLTQLYAYDRIAREAFSRAVGAITRPSPAYHPRGKLVLIGVGKSGHIARKLTATFNSLSVPATFLHPTEALHGDMGVINSRTDTVLLITYSGKTPEITAVMPHLDPALPIILLTGAPHHGKHCDVVRLRPDAIVLPSPVHELETVSFGLAAPTTSTTAALAVGDALALVCAGELHGGRSSSSSAPSTTAGLSMPHPMSALNMPRVATIFARNHPGGAIGASNTTPPAPSPSLSTRKTLRDLAVPWKDIPLAQPEPHHHHSPHASITAADVLRAGYTSPSGWVRICHTTTTTVTTTSGSGNLISPPSSPGVISPSQIRALRSLDLPRRADEVPGLIARRSDLVSVAADTDPSRAADWVRELMRNTTRTTTTGGRTGSVDDGKETTTPTLGPDSVVALLDAGGDCVGVLEVKDLLGLVGCGGG